MLSGKINIVNYTLALEFVFNKFVSNYFRYSNKINLPSFADSRKFKIDNETLNKYQKPIILFMKHISMWAPQGSIIIDVTSGAGTTGVCKL